MENIIELVIAILEKIGGVLIGFLLTWFIWGRKQFSNKKDRRFAFWSGLIVFCLIGYFFL